jgi:hypothetical protein
MNRLVMLVALWLTVGGVVPAVADSASTDGTGSGGVKRDVGPDFHDPDVDGPVFMGTAPDGEVWSVWSYTSGSSADIAVSRWLGNNWSNPEMIGEGNNLRDLDPKVLFLRDETPAVVWWQEFDDGTPSRVVVSYRESNEWTAPESLSPEGISARSPSVFSTPGDDPLVGYVVDDFERERSNVYLTPLRSAEPGEPAGDGGTNGPDPIPTLFKWEENAHWWEAGDSY